MKRQDILIILIPTFICIVFWIGSNIYHSAVTSTISNQENAQIVPISPNFNTRVIDKLKKRERVEPVFKNSSNSAALIIITPTPRPQQLIPIASDSAKTSTISATNNTGGILNQ